MTDLNHLAYAAGRDAAFSKLGNMSKQLRLAVLHAVDEVAPILVRKISNNHQNQQHKKRKK